MTLLEALEQLGLITSRTCRNAFGTWQEPRIDLGQARQLIELLGDGPAPKPEVINCALSDQSGDTPQITALIVIKAILYPNPNTQEWVRDSINHLYSLNRVNNYSMCTQLCALIDRCSENYHITVNPMQRGSFEEALRHAFGGNDTEQNEETGITRTP